MQPILLIDLDDSIMQTARKCPGGAADGLRVMSTLADGSASGYVTPAQDHLLAWLHHGPVVPVTARSRDALARVDIRQAPAICANGGCILTEAGDVDRDWHALLVEQSRDGVAVEQLYAALLEQLPDTRYRHWVAAENELPLYLVFKSNAASDVELAELRALFARHIPPGWREHRNDNNLAYLPPWLGKRAAVRYLVARLRRDHPEAPIVGLGDSISDVGFLDLCDYAMAPTNSQLWRAIRAESAWVD